MNKTMMPNAAKQAISNGKVIKINCNSINLDKDEFCCFLESASTYKDKQEFVGYTGKSAGFNIRIAKGLSYRTGGSGGKAIKQNVRTTYRGYIAITSKRIIFCSSEISFDKPFNKISSIVETFNGLMIQIGSKNYNIILLNHKLFMQVYNLMKNENYEFATEEDLANYKQIEADNRKKTLTALAWIFLFPIMLCIYVWKNKKIKQGYKLPIIIVIIICTILIVVNSNKPKKNKNKEILNNCYSNEAVAKLEELYDVSKLKGNFNPDVQCNNLNLKDSKNNEIIIEEKDNKLFGIKVKVGSVLKYVYCIDKSYDIYDSKTLELKEKADQQLKKERENKENEKYVYTTDYPQYLYDATIKVVNESSMLIHDKVDYYSPGTSSIILSIYTNKFYDYTTLENEVKSITKKLLEEYNKKEYKKTSFLSPETVDIIIDVRGNSKDIYTGKIENTYIVLSQLQFTNKDIKNPKDISEYIKMSYKIYFGEK